jgi:hypothetical protein
LDDWGSNPSRGSDGMFSRHSVETGSGVHTASYPMGPGALSPRVKRPMRENGHTSPHRAEVKNAWSYTSTPPYIFMAW